MNASILIIEDDDTIRTILHRTLTEAGFRCQLAATAAGGWELCLREKPELVLLDVVLPDGNGIALCRRIRAEERLRQSLIVLVTGINTEVESRVSGLEAGADDYIVKPFRLEELVLRVQGLLRSRSRPAGSS